MSLVHATLVERNYRNQAVKSRSRQQEATGWQPVLHRSNLEAGSSDLQLK
jgi:hypothetical protein